jgi:branched-chain amino acid transport system permease protein
MLSIFFVRKGGAENKSVRLLGLLLCLLGVSALVMYGAIGTKQGVLSLLGTVFLYVALTQAWNILGGYGGYLNFGTATFFGIGAYTTGVLFQYYGLSPFLTAPLAGLMAALLGLIIGVPTLRLRGAYFAIVTMIITFAIQIVVLGSSFTQGPMGIFLPPLKLSPIAVERLFFFVFLSLAAVVTLLVYAIENSNFGWALVAIREDEDAAEVIGVKTTMIKYIANAVATFIIGIAGGLYAQRIMYLDPTGVFSFDVSLNVVLMAVIGGAGTWQGPLIAAPLILVVADMLRVTFTSEVNRVIFSVVVILIALYLPHGVMGFMTSLRQKYFKWRKPEAGDGAASAELPARPDNIGTHLLASSDNRAPEGLRR